jgi:hypothetical protein
VRIIKCPLCGGRGVIEKEIRCRGKKTSGGGLGVRLESEEKKRIGSCFEFLATEGCENSFEGRGGGIVVGEVYME